MKPEKVARDIWTSLAKTIKIVPHRTVLSSNSLLKNTNNQRKVEDIIKGSNKNVNLDQRKQHFLAPAPIIKARSLDPIYDEPQRPIRISDGHEEDPLTFPLFHYIREIAVVAIIVVVVAQSIFMLNAGTKFKDTLFQQTLAGIEELKAAKNEISQAHFGETLEHFLAAQSLFTSAKQEIGGINGGRSILPSSLLNISNDLLNLGEAIAAIGGNLTKAIDILTTTTNFKAALPEVKKAQNALRQTSRTLANLDLSILPSEYQPRFQEIQAELPLLNNGLDFFDDITPALLNFTADQATKRYLIMLQNTTERRGTGGFMGSFIEVTFQNGQLFKAEPKDVYNIDWQQFKRKETPEFLRPYMKRFALRDANYNPDFFATMEEIAWSYEASRQGSIDGVIAIDQSIVPQLLEITGPIYLPAFDTTVTRDNYFTILQFFIETNKDDTSTPKRILIDLIHEVAQKLNNLDSVLKLVQFIPQLIQERHIQGGFFDHDLQSVIEKYALDGKLLEPTPELDYLHINAMNIGGNKGDRLLTRDYQHNVSIDKDGAITVTLIGIWQHHWDSKEEQSIQALFPQLNKLSKAAAGNFWHVIGKSPTKHAVRFFVPKGSTLLTNKGLNYEPLSGEENGYQVWYGEVDVALGGTTDFTISYKLPYQLNVQSGDTYRFLLQKQAGAERETLTHQVNLATELEPLANYPSIASQGASNQKMTTDINTDKYFEMLVRKKF
ncbi:MAG: DUF4012 domain-containing protein [Candidatus Abawacabacteria bacterium]|nr:DUF4012 domain-containing protein [Candidatus Abawacabacteria bacterium]